jgi:peptidoglycan hydrolase-like protein with peptidoglycan-binding domain
MALGVLHGRGRPRGRWWSLVVPALVLAASAAVLVASPRPAAALVAPASTPAASPPGVEGAAAPASVPEVDGLAGLLEQLAAPSPYPGRLLGRGLVGDDVRRLQQLLNEAGARPLLKVDGIFGPRTGRAVRQLQRRVHLVPDGVVGPKTWDAGQGAPTPAGPPAPPPAAPAAPAAPAPPPTTSPPAPSTTVAAPTTTVAAPTTTSAPATTTTRPPATTTTPPTTAAPTTAPPTTVAAAPIFPAATGPGLVSTTSRAPSSATPSAAPRLAKGQGGGTSKTPVVTLEAVTVALVLAIIAVAYRGRRKEHRAAAGGRAGRWRPPRPQQQ